jgi:hypothetical protein
MRWTTTPRALSKAEVSGFRSASVDMYISYVHREQRSKLLGVGSQLQMLDSWQSLSMTNTTTQLLRIAPDENLGFQCKINTDGRLFEACMHWLHQASKHRILMHNHQMHIPRVLGAAGLLQGSRASSRIYRMQVSYAGSTDPPPPARWRTVVRGRWRTASASEWHRVDTARRTLGAVSSLGINNGASFARISRNSCLSFDAVVVCHHGAGRERSATRSPTSATS